MGHLQLQVLKALWAAGPATVAEIHAALPHGADLAYTTVATMLRKMGQVALRRADPPGPARWVGARPAPRSGPA